MIIIPETKSTKLKRFAALIIAVMIAAAFACSGKGNDGNTTPSPQENAIFDPEDFSREASGEFSLTNATTGESIAPSGRVYTIGKEGKYLLSGRLDGTVRVDASSADDITLVLDGASISNSAAAPIEIIKAESVTIRAADGSYNTVKDARKTAVDGSAAIVSETDLSIEGGGILIVRSTGCEGIRTKDDLTVGELTLKCVAAGPALRGSDSVTIVSGTLSLISKADGIKTSNSKRTGKGKQKGIAAIYGGTVAVISNGHGIDAAYDAVIGGSASVTISTSTYGGFAASSNPGMGIHASNAISISGGSVSIASTADGLHANAGEALDNGGVSSGNISVTGGTVRIETTDDAIHAEGEFSVTDGTIDIPYSHEGIEANVISIGGGSLTLAADDDALNAQKGANAPLISITGGYLDVTALNGSSDAIDSNGDLVMTGGTVIARSNAAGVNGAGSVEVVGSVSVTGGTIAAFGAVCDTPAAGSVNCVIASSGQFAAGKYTLSDESGVLLEIELKNDYTSCWIASELFNLNSSYSLAAGESPALEWTQSAASVETGAE